MAKRPISEVTVIGSGVMGAAIAAHLANAGIKARLLDIVPKDAPKDAPAGDRRARNKIADAGFEAARKIKPAAFFAPRFETLLTTGNLEDDLAAAVAASDVIIEAIIENLAIKRQLYARIDEMGGSAVVTSNTSGLRIVDLMEGRNADFRRRFCITHFFNPPRYLRLVEIVAGADTAPETIARVEDLCGGLLGKGLVRAKDTPNFIANRVGVFSILAAFHHTQKSGLGFDEVDALTGSLIGRPKSATYRTADVVGLDTLAHVVNTMKETLPKDPWHKYYDAPDWFKQLIDQKSLGQKSGRGVYRKQGKDIQVLDLVKKDYRPSAGEADEAVVAILKNKNVAERFAQLRASQHPQAQFLWAAFRDMLHYCAVHLEAIADNARDLDFAVRRWASRIPNATLQSG